MDRTRLWLLLFLCNIPVYVLWGWLLFRNWANFWEAIVFWFKPEMWLLVEGKYWDDIYAESKLAIWFFAPIGLIQLEMYLLGL